MKSNIEFLYEELRKATDGGSESMTHDDALKQIAYWQDKCNQVQTVELISSWQERIQNKHPASDPEYWPDELIAKYARAEVDDLRREVGRLKTDAQQVAVPARECPYIGDPSRVCNKCGQRYGKPTFPQQVAVPVQMTDGQIKEITSDNSLDTIHAVVRAIEAHHGITPPRRQDMTDRELLEMAAKAAGIECDAKGPFTYASRYDLYNGIHTVDLPWNPLTDDGDALRLAVKLELGVAIFSVYVEVTDGLSIDASEKTGLDAYAATRRAIVRAAAEIGRAMP